MTAREPITVWVDGVGLLAPGIADWGAGRALLRGEAGHVGERTVLPAPELLPAAERRRASRIIKAALAAGLQACRAADADPAGLPNVFASSGGDGDNCHQLCELLASGDRQISPTRFHNSVHNAASGYWSIATGATSAAQVLGAHDASVAAGLLEAMTQIDASGAPVLLVCADSEYPEPLNAKRPIQDASAFALVLTPARGPRSIAKLELPRHGAFRDDAGDAHLPPTLAALMPTMPPMRGLPLLAALAAGQAGAVALAYWPPQWLWLKVAPA
ncbi:beta-ketoacyl synthase chain length factor [Ottowia testudinis]|uniref:Beta-ketoacyl synthase chain length factor n=1 Tax=Ottowia testudinis TaxID=2816950 RepID=A0A975H1C8_9BURK|nr:beta-ketoacyl synthase chain length factor [Ottowia testudinis]QTD43698.1 beta-ketoacyl synthase chain length factor [Ottowia testudinis]